jgi:sugar lactone lactonase YvrE
MRGLVVAGLVGMVTALATPAAGVDYQWVRTVDHYGAGGASTFNEVQAVAVAPSGNVWATNQYGGGGIVKFDGRGNWLGSYGQTNGDGILAESSGNIWATVLHGIEELASDGTVLKQFSSSSYFPPYDDVLSTASDVAVDPLGNLWVTEWANSTYGLEKLSSSGTLLGRYGPIGGGSSQLNGPCGLAIDTSGNIWVSDTNNGRIVEFANDGTTILQQFGSRGSGNGQLAGAEKIAFDRAGNLWVADAGNNRIEEFSNTGAYLGQVGGIRGTGPGQIAGAQGFAFDAAGNLWVADSDNNRLQEFSPVPEPSTLVLLGLGALSLVAYAWRRRTS